MHVVPSTLVATFPTLFTSGDLTSATNTITSITPKYHLYTIGNLAMLTYLNLSYCFFLGQIPSEVSLLHKLSTLMSCNLLFSSVPNQLANISSMTSLILHNGLIGEFPIGILLLPNLQSYGTTQISKVIFLTCI